MAVTRARAKKLDFEQAAVVVLKRHRRAMSVREIVDETIRLNLVKPTGQTPQNSMQNTIRRANQKRKAARLAPLFVPARISGRIQYSLNE